jgi:alginate O-acetyltransferase complex protein AlgI
LLERWRPLAERLDKMPVWLARVYVWLAVMTGWVFFRAENMSRAITYLGTMFTFSLAPVALAYHWAALAALAAGMFLCLLPDKYLPAPDSHRPGAYPAGLYGLQAVLAFVSVAFLLSGSRNPFIYFNF